MKSMKKEWIKYLNSFGTERFFKLRHTVLEHCIKNNLPYDVESLENTLESNKLWYMMYL